MKNDTANTSLTATTSTEYGGRVMRSAECRGTYCSMPVACSVSALSGCVSEGFTASLAAAAELCRYRVVVACRPGWWVGNLGPLAC